MSNEASETSSQDKAISEEPKNEVMLPGEASDDDIAELLDQIPLEKRSRIIEIVTSSITESKSHSGWLPTPDDLKSYNEVLPGLAERIVAMPEREQAHRHKVIETVVRDDRELKLRGQLFAMLSLVLLILVSLILIWFGQYDWAGRIAIFGIFGVVGIFVTGKWVDSKFSKPQDDISDEQE